VGGPALAALAARRRRSPSAQLLDGRLGVVADRRDQQGVHFAIADDGVGMDDGQGLIGMRDRILSAPGAGTTVRGTVPLDATGGAQ
jgi:hypothetical protein